MPTLFPGPEAAGVSPNSRSRSPLRFGLFRSDILIIEAEGGRISDITAKTHCQNRQN